LAFAPNNDLANENALETESISSPKRSVVIQHVQLS
jgi:hypothetical protein